MQGSSRHFKSFPTTPVSAIERDLIDCEKNSQSKYGSGSWSGSGSKSKSKSK